MLVQHGANCSEIISYDKYAGCSLLMLAVAESNFIELIDVLLAGKNHAADPSERFPDGSTVVGRCVRKLIDAGYQNWPLLAYAVSQNKTAVARILIARGADLDAEFLESGEKIKVRDYIAQKNPSLLTLQIPFAEIKIAEPREGQVLGRGGYGVVYKADWQGTAVAVKIPGDDVPAISEEMLGKKQQEFEEEANRHARIKHPNIIALYAICLEAGKYSMVMELMVKGSLFDVLHNRQDLPWSVRLSIAQDICNGILFLHAQQPPIIHRDLKSLNVLLNSSMRTKICDFGLAKVKNTSRTMTPGAIGTCSWMAPELLEENGKCSQASDIYALAIILWEIASREEPHKNIRDLFQLIDFIRHGYRDPIPDNTPPKFSELIRRCWSQNKDERPTAPEITREMMGLRL